MRKLAALAFLTLSLPAISYAFPFGGQAAQVIPCYNQAIWASLGPPRGGFYIWTPSTRTYPFGPPSHAGQWLLGLASAPYYCLVSIEPIIVYPGIAIDMMGSSGSSAAQLQQLLQNPQSFNGNVPTPVGTPTGIPVNPTLTIPSTSLNIIGHIVVSEVFFNVDSAHGAAPKDQWIELYNGSFASVDLSGWRLQSGARQFQVPAGTSMAPGQFLMIVTSSSTLARWNTPAATASLALGGTALFSGGFAQSDSLFVLDTGGAVVDGLSWGGNTNAFNPSATTTPAGSSLARTSLSVDTNAAADFMPRALPTPGW